ncbi:MAG TPA: hypothetical protein VGZ50_08545, partial [Actinomycetota bacterium]|nr:hypothetical protein [Actinomycetota bacterium]
MRRAGVALALSLLALIVPARAQEQETLPVRLTLVDQTPFATPKQRIRLTIRATNLGPETLGNLDMTLSVYYPARSRSEYEQALREEPPAVFETKPYPVDGVLDPAAERTLSIQQPIPELAAAGGSA